MPLAKSFHDGVSHEHEHQARSSCILNRTRQLCPSTEEVVRIPRIESGATSTSGAKFNSDNSSDSAVYNAGRSSALARSDFPNGPTQTYERSTRNVESQPSEFQSQPHSQSQLRPGVQPSSHRDIDSHPLPQTQPRFQNHRRTQSPLQPHKLSHSAMKATLSKTPPTREPVIEVLPAHVKQQQLQQSVRYPYAICPSVLANGSQPPPPHPMHLPVLQRPVRYVPSPPVDGNNTAPTYTETYSEMHTPPYAKTAKDRRAVAYGQKESSETGASEHMNTGVSGASTDSNGIAYTDTRACRENNSNHSVNEAERRDNTIRQIDKPIAKARDRQCIQNYTHDTHSNMHRTQASSHGPDMNTHSARTDTHDRYTNTRDKNMDIRGGDREQTWEARRGSSYHNSGNDGSVAEKHTIQSSSNTEVDVSRPQSMISDCKMGGVADENPSRIRTHTPVNQNTFGTGDDQQISPVHTGEYAQVENRPSLVHSSTSMPTDENTRAHEHTMHQPSEPHGHIQVGMAVNRHAQVDRPDGQRQPKTKIRAKETRAKLAAKNRETKLRKLEAIVKNAKNRQVKSKSFESELMDIELRAQKLRRMMQRQSEANEPTAPMVGYHQDNPVNYHYTRPPQRQSQPQSQLQPQPRQSHVQRQPQPQQQPRSQLQPLPRQSHVQRQPQPQQQPQPQLQPRPWQSHVQRQPQPQQQPQPQLQPRPWQSHVQRQPQPQQQPQPQLQPQPWQSYLQRQPQPQLQPQSRQSHVQRQRQPRPQPQPQPQLQLQPRLHTSQQPPPQLAPQLQSHTEPQPRPQSHSQTNTQPPPRRRDTTPPPGVDTKFSLASYRAYGRSDDLDYLYNRHLADNSLDVGRMYTAYQSQGGKLLVNDRGSVAWKCEFEGCGIIFAVKTNRDNHYQKAHIDGENNAVSIPGEALKRDRPDTISSNKDDTVDLRRSDGERASNDDNPLVSPVKPRADGKPLMKKLRLDYNDDKKLMVQTFGNEVAQQRDEVDSEILANPAATTTTAQVTTTVKAKKSKNDTQQQPTKIIKSLSKPKKANSKSKKAGPKVTANASRTPKAKSTRAPKKSKGTTGDGDDIVLLTESDLFPILESTPDASTISPVKPLESEPPPTIGLFALSSRPADSSVPLTAFEMLEDGHDRGSREMIGTDDTHTHIKARAADVTVEQDRASTLGRSEIGLNLLSESSRRRKNSYSSVGSEDVDLTVGLFGPQTSKPIPPRKILGLPLQTEETSGDVAKLELDTQTEFEEPFVELTEADIFGLSEPATVPNHRPLPETEAVNRNDKSNGSVGDTVSPEPKPAVAATDYAPPDIMQMTESDLIGTEESAQPNEQPPQSEFRNRTKTDIAHLDVGMTTSPHASPVKASNSSQRATRVVADSAHAPMPTTSSKFFSPSSEGSGEDDSDDESAPAQHTVPPIEELTMADLRLEGAVEPIPYHVPMQSINRACEFSHTNGVEDIAATTVSAKDTLPSVAVTSKPPKLVRIPKKPAPPRLSALDMLLSSAPKVKSALANAMVKGLLDTSADSGNHSDGAEVANTKQTSRSTFAGIHHEDTFGNSGKVKTEALPVVGQVFSDLIPDVGGDAFTKESNQNARNGRSQLTEREMVEEASIGIKSEPVQQPVHKSPSAHENRSLDTDGKQVVEGLTHPSIHNESTTQPKGGLTHHSLNTSTPMFTTNNATTSTNTKAAKPISTSTSTQVDSTTPGPADMATAIDETSPDTSSALSTTRPKEGAVRNDGAPKVGLFADTVPMVRAIDQLRQPNRCSGSIRSEGSEPSGLVYPPGSGLCAESLRAIGVETPCQLVLNRIVRFQELRAEDRVCSFVSSRMSMASCESNRDAVRLYSEAIVHMVDNTKRMGGGSCVSHLPLKISAKDVDQLHPRCATSPPQRTDRREDADVLSQLYTKRAICLDALKYHIKAEADCVEALICDSENLECMLAYARMQMSRGVISQVDLSLSRVQDVLDKQTTPSHEHSFSDELHTLTTIVDKLKAMYLIIKVQYEPNLEGHDPDSAESSTQYSATLVRAIKMLQSRCPRSVNCQLWYARYLRLGLGDLEAATTLLTEVYESDPMTGMIPLVSELSLCAYENADFETVIAIVDNSVLQGTSDSSKIDKATKMTIGQLRVGMQQRLQKSIVLCHWRREGKLAFNRGDYVDAAENYTNASELTEPYHPTNMAICLNNKAMCLMQRAKIFKKSRQPKIALARLKEAMACCDKALVLKSNFAKSIIRKAGVYTLLGDFADNLTTRIRQYKNAKEVYEDVLPMQPNNQEIRERFLLLEEKLKKANFEKRIQDERSKREQELEEERIRDELHRAEAARGQRKSSRKKLDGAHITQTLYEVLNVPPTATTEDIKKAYKTLARTHHPDKNEDGNPERFQEIVGAHATLADPSKRKEYDRSLIGTGLNKRSGISRQFGNKR